MLPNWIKSSRCSGGDCVELAELPGGRIAIRDSKHPDQPPLVFTQTEMAVFFAGVLVGDFDDLAGGIDHINAQYDLRSRG